MMPASGIKSVRIIDNDVFDGPSTNLLNQLQN